MQNAQIKGLFLDIGGVLLTNGWGHQLREKTAKTFGFELEEFTLRHEMIFELFEIGKLSFDSYLEWTIFYKLRNFSLKEVKSFIFDSVEPFPEMIEYVKELKSNYGLKLGVVSNEGKELAVDRIQRFNMTSYIDFFIVSSFVHFRKPDADIYTLAIDVAQMIPAEICYIDDRALLIESAAGLGLHCIHHTSFESTKKRMDTLLQVFV